MKLNNEEYEKLEGIRRSDLWKLNKTPLHFKYALDNPDEPTKELLFGIAAHKYILEREDFHKVYAILPKFDRRTKAGREEYEKFMADHEGMLFLDEEDFEKIRGMGEVIDAHPVAKELLTGLHEEAYQWVDEETQESCKIKSDCITTYKGNPYIVDYKTTSSCENGSFEWSSRKYGYDFQAGMYCEGVAKNTLEEYGFVFVAQEKTAPYAVRVYWCSDEFIESGKRKYHGLIKKYHECKETNSWPGYEDEELLEEYYG